MARVSETTKALIALVDRQAGAIVADPSPTEPQAELVILRPLWQVVQTALRPYGSKTHDRQLHARVGEGDGAVRAAGRAHARVEEDW